MLTLTLKSQTLTGFIFKCDLNFGKIKCGFTRKVGISQDRQNGENSKCWVWLEKGKVWLWLELLNDQIAHYMRWDVE